MAEVLVSCDWLNGQITGNPPPKDLVIIDVSWASTRNCQEDYASEHIPSAVYLSVLDGPHSDLYPRNVPKLEDFQKAVREIGVNNSSHVVLYSNTDQCGFFLSGRAWWTFQIFGHANVSVLNGGLQKWKSLNYATTSAVSQVQPGDFEAKWNKNYYRKMDEVVENLPTQQFQLVDTRAGNAPVEKGKIPGSQHLPLSSLVDTENLQLKSTQEVKK